MGRNKLVMKKIEDPISRQQFYSKRKDTILKKSNELAVLCDTDVALLMFSPAGQVTSYSSKESVEDIMVRAMNKSVNQRLIPNPNEQLLMQSLTQSKSEGKMVGKIAIAEAHGKKLNELKETLIEAQQKIRYYKPQVENISSVQEAEAYAQFLRSNMEQIQQSKAKLLGVQGFLQKNEYPAVNTEDMAAAGNESSYLNAYWNQ
ncbi:agamous-like MADS-box protein AGL66 isoform X1 [Solanum tuberosum]|uniref:agamous-like MADS-box protein AGL66 isoform X1 n=1 Tax=Solanum tuberosum TaxID=4113 RepID=UPI00073A06D8|nr:PREDICTED: agamous-like MADS-box protein AGL66 isoform X1 [Solanum tuberosum]XP_015170383.1 PREDICTED: agamous-like MADS-box protein AGL66 isoform X1 [Solanum tuberosum]XP_015170384.1 PREDICTED: agamous-like MADS-box protein AGL66 isoform X1 [Solanum tuberosum]